jgi:O-antigen ligase
MTISLSRRPLAAFCLTACFAIGTPMLLAFNLPPSATFLNQAAAFIGWGGFLLVLAAAMPQRAWAVASPGLHAAVLALVLLGVSSLASRFWAGLPWSLALCGFGMLATAILVVMIAAAAQSTGWARRAFLAFCVGLVFAGVLSSLIGIVQVFAPQWPDGEWIAKTYIPGRAVGNMRQPNHLSSLLVWAVIAAVWLGETGAIRRWASAALTMLFVFVIVLTASRTGTLSVGLLLIWAALDKRLSRQTRTLLALAPLAYAVFWLGMSAWADYSSHLFGGETRFSTKGDISSSRWGIWSNTLTLIRMHPWAGVGFGEFNFAWTLTPFPGRPVAFFDHTHNIVLQFAVELGLPLATLVLALLGWALWAAWRGAKDSLRRAALVMVLMILLHSLLEYPLWYSYFLFPAAFAFGLCLGRQNDDVPGAATSRDITSRDTTSRDTTTLDDTSHDDMFGDDISRDTSPNRDATRPFLIASMLLMLGGMLSVVDYIRVVAIFAPPEGAASLSERIKDGQHSVFFAHQADYAAATTAENPADALPAFRSAPHNLLDARLMMAWAKALNASGDTDRARTIAQRLKEFRNDAATEFFAPCDDAPTDDEPLPFQCELPTRPLGYEDFR